MDQMNNRSKRLTKNVVASFLLKGWSAVVVFLSVPITLKCLGEYNNGVWLTISSMLLWIDNFDIGLGNGMRNKLSIYLAQDDIKGARSLISSTFAMLTTIIIPVLLFIIGLIFFCDTYSFLNVNPNQITDLNTILITTVLLVCITFIFKLTGNFYMGLQLPAISNLLVACGQTLSLIGTYVVYMLGSHSLMHIALINTGATLIVYLLAFPITFGVFYPELRPSPKLATLQEAKTVANTGLQFFVLQIASLILFATSNILISKIFTPAMVTPYQITYRYFSIFMVIFTVICMPFWNATTDAYVRGDYQWIRNASQKMKMIIIAIFIGMVVMTVVSEPIYKIWVGQDIHIDPLMTVLMATYIFTLIYSMRYSYFINGIGTLRLQMIFTTGAAIIFIPLAFLVATWTNSILWFMVVLCVVNIPGAIVNKIQFHKLIYGTPTGIWIK